MTRTPTAAQKARWHRATEERLPKEYIAESIYTAHGQCYECGVPVHTLWWGLAEDREGREHYGEYGLCPTEDCDGAFIPDYWNFEG